jgi:hypothetical protein
MLIKYIYTFFVGLFLAIFVALGISVLHPEPKAPEYPPSSSYPQDLSLAEKQEVRKYEQRTKEYTADIKAYNRTVSIASLIAAIIILAIALMFADKLGILADGLLLGGIFTLLYGLIRGLETDSDNFRFLVATIGLGVTLVLGYLKFIRQPAATAKPAGKAARRK